MERTLGVNLSGWFIPEPWVTPSLYAATGASNAAELQEAMGTAAYNERMRRHYETFVSEDDFRRMAQIGLNAVRLPVQRSPKVVITTNYTVGGVGGSFERRKWEVELSAHFNAKHTPQDEFGHMRFDEWDGLEWARFDAYMVGCLSQFLREGLVAAPFKNLKVRKFIKHTSHEFWEWCFDGNLELGPRHVRGAKMEEFTREYPDYKERGKYAVTQKRFTQWMAAWGEFNGWEVGEGKDQSGNRYTYYRTDADVQEESDEAPF